MSWFIQVKASIVHGLNIIRSQLSDLKNWTVDHLSAVADDVYRLLDTIYGVQPGTYWLIFISGPLFILLGMELASLGDKVFAPAFISVGAGIWAVYWANFLQKLTTSIPRIEWAHKAISCSDKLVSYLLELNETSVTSYSSKSYNRELKAIVTQEAPLSRANIRKLEIMLRKRKIGFLLKLESRQLKEIKRCLLLTSRDIQRVSQHYGTPIANRKFNQDLASLRSSLQEAIDTLEAVDKKELPPTELIEKRPGLFSQLKTYEKNSTQRQAKIYTRSTYKKDMQANPGIFWPAAVLIEHLRALIAFTNTYGYSNNAAASMIESRRLYIRDRFK